MADSAKWWCIEVKRGGNPPSFLGRVEATESEIRASLGRGITIEGNCVTVWAPPSIR